MTSWRAVAALTSTGACRQVTSWAAAARRAGTTTTTTMRRPSSASSAARRCRVLRLPGRPGSYSWGSWCSAGRNCRTARVPATCRVVRTTEIQLHLNYNKTAIQQRFTVVVRTALASDLLQWKGNYSATSNNMTNGLLHTARRRLGGTAAHPSPSSLYQM